MVAAVEKKHGLREAPVCNTDYSGNAAVVTAVPQHYGNVCLTEVTRKHEQSDDQTPF